MAIQYSFLNVTLCYGIVLSPRAVLISPLQKTPGEQPIHIRPGFFDLALISEPLHDQLLVQLSIALVRHESFTGSAHFQAAASERRSETLLRTA